MRRLLAAALVLSFAGSAGAWVRSRTEKGTPVFWPASCVFIVPDEAGSLDMPLETVLQVIDRTIANWQTPSLGRAYLRLQREAPAKKETLYDKTHVIKFRDGSRFCRPADGGKEEVCYSAQATAITTIFYNSAPGKPADGTILDADIELNQVNFTFVNLPAATQARPGTSRADLENTLTHELGHLQGLDHICRDSATLGDPVDGNGQPIPDCIEVRQNPVKFRELLEATMYNFTESAAEIKKRTPEADDQNALSAVYPTDKDPKQCKRPGEGGCAVGGRGDKGAWALAGLALLAWWGRRRLRFG